MEQKLEALKDCILVALYKKWLYNIVVGYTAVGDCNREEKLCSARGSNEGMQEIKKKIMKKCEYGELSEAIFVAHTTDRDRQTDTAHLEMDGRAMSS